MELPDTTGRPIDLLATPDSLPDVPIGVGFEEPFDESEFYGVASAHDLTADIDTSVLGGGGYDDVQDYPPLDVDAKLPVVDRHRVREDDDGHYIGVAAVPTALRPEDTTDDYGAGGAGRPPGPPGDEPPRGGGGDYGDGDDGGEEDDGGEAALRAARDAANVERAHDAAQSGVPADDSGFSWLQPERAPAAADTEGSEPDQPTIEADEVDKILYGKVTIRGKEFGTDVDSPDFEPPQAAPAAPAIFDAMTSETVARSTEEAAAQRVVELAREAGALESFQLGTDVGPGVREEAPAQAEPTPAELQPATEPAPTEDADAALAAVPTAEALAPELAAEITAGGTPAARDEIDPRALKMAAGLRRFRLASEAGRAAAAAASADRGEEPAIEQRPVGPPAEPAEPPTPQGRSVEFTLFPATQAGLPARPEGVGLSPADRAMLEPPPEEDPVLSLDEEMLTRVLSGLRRSEVAPGQVDPDARQAAMVEVTDEEVAAAGGDRALAIARKLEAMGGDQPPSSGESGLQ
jgi:hypothetical protein